MRNFEPETDGYCPKCDNHFFIDAKTPQTDGYMAISLQGDSNMVRDEREKQKRQPGEGLELPVN